MSAFKDLSGMKFGRLTVLERVENQGRYTCWRCRCECGNIRAVRSDSLKSGKTQSCGCLHRESAVANVSKHHRHKKSNISIYKKWQAMKKRCFKPNDKRYKDYGGRGITVYPAWIHDFQAFFSYVIQLEHCGEAGYTLDRIDNDGNYEPGNLRWATQSEQARNRRSNILVEYEGKEITLVEASERSGINFGTLRDRYWRGDRGERLFRPVRPKKK